MSIIALVTGIVVALGFLGAGLAKVTKQDAMVQAAGHLGFAMPQFQMIGAAEVAGAVGVVLGLISDDLEWLGALAAAGLVVVALGAVANHRRVGDPPAAAAPAGVLGVLALVHLVATLAA